MPSQLNPFWNNDEHRLRALWRIVIHFLLFVTLTTLFGAIALATLAIVGTGSLANITAFDSENLALDLLLTVGATVSMVLALWVAGRLLDRRRFVDFGLRINRAWWIDLSFGLLLGVLLMAGIFIVQLIGGWITIDATFVAPSSMPFVVAFGAVFLRFVGVGIYEEMLSRGYHLVNLAEGLKMSFITPRQAVILGWVISSAIFGLLHASNPNATLLSTLNIVIAGIMLGLPFVLTRSLAIPIGLHIAWNFAQGNIFGFPVSGTAANTTSLITVTQGGPDWLTGGAFGPEGGLIGLVAMGIGMALIIWWIRQRTGQVLIDESIALYPSQKSKSDSTLDQAAMQEQIRQLIQ